VIAIFAKIRSPLQAYNSIMQHRSPEISEAEDIYGWLIGSWDLDVRFYRTEVKGLKGEALFERALEGRAIRDEWIMPPRSQRSPDTSKERNMYGTTLRIWDSAIQAWRVTWINPVTNWRDELIGRRVGDRLVQIGSHADGTPIRWIFSEITTDSFRWTGEALQPDGETWKLEAEFFASRRKA
jgi:hypothetical protein